MSFSNLHLMRETREALSPHWGLSVFVTFIFVLILGVPSSLQIEIGELIPFLLTGPLSLGFSIYALTIVRGDDPHFEQLFQGFKHFFKSFLAYFCMSVLTVFGFVLLIIPGIYISLALSMTFYIMADRPELSFSQCLNESWTLTKGYRLKYLGLSLRFIPWYFLGLLCFGVGVLLVIPWSIAAGARFYEELKRIKANEK